MGLKKNVSNSPEKKPQVGILCSEFHKELVVKLYEGAKKEFLKQSVQIAVTEWIPGAGEIPQAGRWLMEKRELDGLLACGVLIRGETSHFESLCRLLEKGLLDLQTDFSLPVIFSVLMLENRLQAANRLGGNKGHRGREAAQTLVKMLSLKQKLSSRP